ncbi:MAG TPA: class I tRNA ligase family protein [Streptosporangiaceae bacterium]|nr:class I tRNA ligase family protein [Streptosporangiaceae bacterium]
MRQVAGAPAGRRAPGRLADGPADSDLAAVERQVLARWARTGVPGRSLAGKADGPRWLCYENPPAASGMPGIHQLPGLAVRDMYRRLKSMQGFHVPRNRGWNCHGLQVEVAVESELGLSGRADIEAYGPERFAARCRESAQRHADAMSALSARMGYWTDDAACRTMDASFVESVWGSLRPIFDAGLLVRDHRVGPYCPRCQTPLAAHDIGQPDPRKPAPGTAVIVRFRLASLPAGASPRLRGADLLVLATAPWTLAANAAIAVHPHQTYVLARRAGQDDQVILAEPRLAGVLGGDWRVAARLTGTELAGATYHPLLEDGGPAGPRPVIAGYFTTARDGTGLTHVAPAYDEQGRAACLAHGVDVTDPIGPDGRFESGLPLVGGVLFADADPILVGALSDRRLIFASSPRECDYPRCLRCGTPLLFRAQPAWRIRTTATGDRVGAVSERSCPNPGERSQQADGRPGRAWLGTGSDWTLSRTRYWGTPLPLWECARGHFTCVGSLSELSELAGRDLAGLDPHRPHIDAVTITCPRCGGVGRRVPEVIDAWYDAGWMPFALHGVGGANEAATADAGDDTCAQLVAESTDQAPEWFGALLTVGALVHGKRAFGTALRLGTVLDDGGRSMSRSLGNVVEPLPLIERYGADAARWFFATAPPGAARQNSDAALEEITRVLLAYRDSAAFLIRGAAGGPGPGGSEQPGERAVPAPAARSLLDRWILSELHALVRDVTADLEAFGSAAACARIAGFIDALSSRYLDLCRGRDRFRQYPNSREYLAARATLYDCIEVLTRLMAPITPFLTDHVWSLLRSGRPELPESVHLARWPVPVPALIDDSLAGQVADRAGAG